MQNKYLGVLIVFFFSGTVSSLVFRLIDISVFRNAQFQIQNSAYSNLLILLISVLITYTWITKNNN
jgi:RsiW-degrading membrane proteinase PrsW (M82 family)